MSAPRHTAYRAGRPPHRHARLGLPQLVTDNAADSAIVEAQQDAAYNVITLEAIDETQKSMNLAYLGGESVPLMMFLYPKDFESKDAVLAYLDDYNVGLDEADAVIYTDLAKSVTEMTGGIMDGITLVLVAFAAISLVVSLIMISIITYISVLERTKEIGVLRALGARKKDITRVFTAETFIIGVFSGLLGIGIAYILTIPANTIIENMTGLAEVSQLPVLYAFVLVAMSGPSHLSAGRSPHGWRPTRIRWRRSGASRGEVRTTAVDARSLRIGSVSRWGHTDSVLPSHPQAGGKP